MKKTQLFKILSLVVIMALFFTMAVGCSKDEEPADTEDPAGSESSDSADAGDDEEPAEEPSGEDDVEPIDLDGYEFVFASHWIHEFFPEEGASEDGDMMLERYQEVEDKYNCKITPKESAPDEFVPNVIAAVMAGDKYADILDMNWGWFQTLRAGNYLAPLDEVPEFNINDTKWDTDFTNFGTFGGHIYGTNYVAPHRPKEARGVLFFNKTLLEREGQPNIYQLVQNKEWTWEKFNEIMKAVTKDTDGDGVNDIWGVNTIGNGLEMQAIWSNGGRVVKEQDGKMVFSLNDQAVYEALQFVHDIINVDKLFKYPAAETDWTQPAMDFLEGNVAFHVMEYWFAPAWGVEMEDDFGIVPFPMGPQADDYVSMHSDARLYAMTTSNNDKDKAAIIFNAITEPFDGVEQDSWKEKLLDEVLRDEESLATLEYIFDGRMAIDLSAGIPGLDYGEAINSVTRTAESTPKAAMEAIAEQMQAAIDDFFK